MGAFKEPWGLLWVSVLVVCVLLAYDRLGKVRAESQEDSDLIFDSLEPTNLKNHRIARSSSFSSQQSSQESGDDHHWLSRTVNRIKRTIGNILSNDENPHEGAHHGKVPSHHKGKKLQDENQNVRKPRQQFPGDYRDGDEEDPEGQGQVEYGNYDTDGGQRTDEDQDNDLFNRGQYEFPPFEEYDVPGSPGIDDEDTDDFGSGKDGGSGEIDQALPSFATSTGDTSTANYYRFTVAIEEFYRDYFKDRDTREFQEVARRMEEGINQLLAEHKRGKRSCTVISIEEDKAHNFKCLVTFDIVSTADDDQNEIKNLIYRQIEEKGTLGSYPAVTDGFSFLPFGDEPPRCEESQVTCKNTQCIHASARCDGKRDCNDNSDEIDCPNIPEPPVDVTTILDTTPEETTLPHLTETASPITTTTTTTTPEPDRDFGSGDGEEPRPTESPDRTDDIIDCADGVGIYYGDQRCDGTPQCRDESDEANCSSKCMQGEFSCDVARCIPVSNRCDGIKQCDDGTDEQECDDCPRHSDSFHCDNQTVCLLSRRVCDGTVDCRDGTDEHNCPGGQCLPSEFNCENGQCIPGYLKCTGTPECSNGADERGCPGISAQCSPSDFSCGDGQCIPSHLRCTGTSECSNGADEEGCPGRGAGRPVDTFTCGSGEVIPMKKYCDREYDCDDQSDERSCPCLDTDFHCDNGFCIGFRQRCDGVRQCQDGSDEFGCESEVCSHYQWQCHNRQCIDQIFRCDHKPDCNDGSDEIDCTFCGPETFRCDNGSCIPISKRCDQVGDCPYSEDEEHCETASCTSEEFKCLNGQCISKQLRCNTYHDCVDGSDELECESPCPPGEFRCTAGFCIMGYKLCNGYKDCEDNSDEENCPTLMPPGCHPQQVRCSEGRCAFPCNGVAECADRSDESNCTNCRSDQFQCRSGGCVDIRLRCDHLTDCVDNSDEENCGDCDPQQVRCRDGRCAFPCDGIPECEDRSDESNCTNCRTDQFQCRSGNCIDMRLRCDHFRDCVDNSDEENCGGCQDDEFDCGGDICVEISRRCDGQEDCPEGNDEQNCGAVTPPQPAVCQPDEFDCGNNRCINQQFRCDGYADCENKADELNCECQPNEFRCKNGQCIPQSYVCDGTDHCSDGLDEFNCTTTCLPSEFKCERDNRCIPHTQICDRVRQCSDGADEIGCPCSSDEFQCSNGQCIAKRYHCDRRVDCSDGSDEYNCAPPTEIPPSSCPFGYVSCHSNDKCIRRNQLCDGRVDCRDMSDEAKCDGDAKGLQLRTYPNQQDIRENQEVVFQCRDEGENRARVEWRRANGLPLPEGSRDVNGRLEMPNIRLEHGGTYVCVAKDYPLGTPGAEVDVQLHVEKTPVIYVPPPVNCHVNESTCGNGECIPRNKVCDGSYDCSDGSDEIRCQAQCEPNEFRCDNKKCVLAVWKCDGQDDCGDGSDERDCAQPRPGQKCSPQQFTCMNEQCIPRSFHCDGQPDCIDRSDEIGCREPVIAQTPPPMTNLNVGETYTITCRAVGVPTPHIMWRLNWHHVPIKCVQTSENGFGTLTCENIQVEDQGAYTCEAVSTIKSVMATPDNILVVNRESVCSHGYFNVEARSQSECIKCFCFGHTSNCRSADLFVFQFQPPFDSRKLLGARIDPRTGVVDIRDEPIYKGLEPTLQDIGRNGVRAWLPYYTELNQPSVVPYFALPENYHGNQLKSYGGYLRYTVRHGNQGRPLIGPDVILTGNDYVLLHQSRLPPEPHYKTDQRVRFFEGDWIIKSANQPERFATREDIMMALEDVSNILIKLEYNEGVLNTTLLNIEMDSAAVSDNGLGLASYVEECSCPVGYTGSSCESCAEGYSHQDSGRWLGQCSKALDCPPGSYFDGRQCEACPCPYTSPSNQFARSCHKSTDGNVVCDCQQGYTGLRCEHCAPGYIGNPLTPGDICRPQSYCDPQGTLGQDPEGRCLCKEYTTGQYCDQCKPNSFYLSTRNQFGCISCFCMGVTQQCSKSDWYRDSITSVFTSSLSDFKLTDIYKENTFSVGIKLHPESREIVYNTFGQPEVYYWSLPNKYLGDKVASYGGYLKYVVRNTPVPGGASSRNNAPEVELISENHINLQYFSTNITQPTNAPQTFVVPLLEQYWQRNDGQKADREHLLMALADVKAIYVKATYFTNTEEAALISVSMDTATETNTGRERAHEVEQCHCPQGYTGLSCEDCAFGYTRSEDGIYLELCRPCECNGHSNDCDPETGICRNCRDNTAGDQCEQCLPGYTGDPLRGIPCSRHETSEVTPCQCDPRGSTYNGCVNGQCQCKANVEGPNCDRCRNGTFGLGSQNIDGCEFCFCSGVSSECSESQLNIEQIPIQITDEHGFILTDQYFKETIKDGFKVSLASNEIGYTFPPSQRGRIYWSLPSTFTRNQIKSYGGKLEYMQRYIDLPHAKYYLDKDIIITGNNMVIYWTNPEVLKPERVNSVSARIHPSAKWFRLDQNRSPKSASREDIMTVLANIDTILIRATPSTDTSSTFLSDISLDTAVDMYTAKPRASSVESCRCPPGYSGTSCESCSSGFYKDFSYSDTNPMGSCRRCPCNNREESCRFDASMGIVVCNCLPGFNGRECESTEIITIPPGPHPRPPEPTPVPPTIEVTITDRNIEIYELGSNLVLNCSGRSRVSQRVNLVWSKDHDQLPYRAIDTGDGTLIIRNLTAVDSGRYICTADDGYSVVTESVSVVVGGQDRRPEVSLFPSSLQASEGQLIEIRCVATGNPKPDFFVSRTDGQLLNPSHTFDQGVFRILQAKSSDNGQYQCTAVNRAGENSRSFEINVLAGSVLRVEIEPRDFDARAGDQVVLRCVADRAINIRWSKEGGALPYQYRELNGQLTIPNAQPSDSGSYICTATSADGTRGTQNAIVTVRGGGGVHPTAKVIPEQLTLRQGDSTEIRCEATGAPTPSVKWTKLYSDMGSNVEQIGNSLYIRNARFEDRGVYVCIVENDLGLEQGVTTVEVTRFEVPLVQIFPEGRQSVSAGNGVQLQCRTVQGYPAPTITWSRENGTPFSPNVEIMTGGVLRILDISPNESGEYVCSATNEAGTARSTTYIQVISPPALTIVPNQEIIVKAVNEYLKLACYGTGQPLPAVRWAKAEEIDYLRSSLLDRPNTDAAPAFLEFTRLRPEDAGVYVCRGQNDAGTEDKRVQVDVLPERGDNPGKGGRYYPGGDQGSSPPDVNTFDAVAGARAEIRCKVTTSDDSRQFVDWIRSDNRSLPEGAYSRQGTLYIDNVQPNAAGDYECVTYELPSRTVLYRIRSRLRVLAPPEINLEPKNQTVEPGQNAFIRCVVVGGEQPVTIQWLPVDRSMPASVYTTEGYIRFENIHPSDAGKYRCVARNSAGEANSVAEVKVAYQPTSHRPTIEAVNHVVESSIGSTVQLVCRPGAGTETSPVTWHRDNGPLPVRSRIDGAVLHIFDLEKADEGQYLCQVATPNGDAMDYVRLVAVGPKVKSLPPKPALHISPEEPEYPVGANIDLTCHSNEPGVIPLWSKISGGLADNVQNRAGRLMIYNARLENAGAYRCDAHGDKGHYYKNYTVNIRAPEDQKDEIPIQVQRAKRKASVILECNTDFDEPVTYLWNKQGGSLPFYIDEYSKKIQLNSVGSIDAGTYICQATSQSGRTLEIPIVLVVTGIIPYFTQAPNSFISLPTLADAYLQFSFEISFRPESDYGLILYNGNRDNEREQDFISLALNNGIPEFKFNLGPGTPTTTVKANETITTREWHTIKVVRNKKRVIMYIDGKGPYIGENEGKYFGLDLSEPLFLGGVPDYDHISPEVGIDRGLVGCISKFKIGYSYQDILHESIDSVGITNCETCTESKCQNQGTCQEALTIEGYACICPTKYSGPTCNKRKGEACSPYACGVGRCIDTEYSYKCQCPLGHGGRNCEKTIQIYEASFKDNAYIAYPPLRPLKRTRIEMRIKPRDTSDGILLYAAETNEGHGDFISLAVKDKRIEIRFDNGKGPLVIRSDNEIEPNQWSAIIAIRSAQDGRIMINGHPSSPAKFNAYFKTPTVLTPLYIGGYDQYNIRLNQGVKVKTGFNGCITDINISGLDEATKRNITDSSNVENCSDEDDIDNGIPSTSYFENSLKPVSYDSRKTGCSDNPCKNNAQCIPLSPVAYKCSCPPAFTGQNCEFSVDLCRSRPCQNGGICSFNNTGFTCDCTLGYSGKTCDQRVELRNDAHFDKNGWLEFSEIRLPHRYEHESEIIALEFSTNKSDGLMFWQGKRPEEDGQGKDYIYLALTNGFLEFSYDLGSGPAVITTTQIRVDDGDRHSVILKRQGRQGSIDIDHSYTQDGESEGDATSLDTNGNIYLGGVPNISRMTGNRFSKGFEGCVHGFELQQSKTLDLGMTAINGLNVKSCSSFSDIDNNIWDEKLVN